MKIFYLFFAWYIPSSLVVLFMTSPHLVGWALFLILYEADNCILVISQNSFSFYFFLSFSDIGALNISCLV